MKAPLPPFSCTHSPNVPELLNQLNCTLAISTYQAGKVILISAKDTNRLIQLPRQFNKPMGLAVADDKLAIATKDEVVILSNASKMAHNYPKKKNTYDAFFLPRTTYYTGALDIHDLVWVNNEIWAVNTVFSCLIKLSQEYNFEPVWRPSFVPDYTPVDYCHLNGLAMEAGQPKYVSALGRSDKPDGWRKDKVNGGVIMDITSDAIVAQGLGMPHSPRIIEKELFLLLSATGELVRIDRNNGKVEVVKQLDGFVRGMTSHGDYLFIGLSKVRTTSSSFRDLPIAEKATSCGIAILHIPTLSIVGYIKYETSVEEIYDLRILKNTSRPGLLNHEKSDHKIALTSPVGDFWLIEDENNAG
ncbi:MAG: TIGR03032 family protein [Bacteroidota bacterium]